MHSTQANRPIAVNTVLGPDVLLLASMGAKEYLSRPFEYELALLSERIDIPADDLLGTPATVALQRPSGERRFFNGYINGFSHVGFTGTYARYRASLVPWLWFLSRRADCRIFQHQSVPDIVAAVFRDHGFTDFEQRLSGSYRQWTYCVQYRESDLNFVQRLLEHEGIYYFHEHTDGKHLLVLADSQSAHSPAPGYDTVAYFSPDQTLRDDRERIDDWHVGKQARPGAFAHTAFDFTVPRKNLLARNQAPKDHALAGHEVFDFQGDYTQTPDGERYARIRLEERQADHELVQAAGNARGLTCGGLFTLTEHPRADQNRKYLIVSASYQLQSDDYGTATATASPVFQCNLSALDANIAYRPPRVTPKPTVQGPQTAMVVGKAGEEIWTDKHGRVKVQFHWDRYGAANETSSCWVRVSHPWAGKGWGAVAIPRIGQEVIVDFLEGDPDQPIITGRVYNGTNMPPYGLPASAVISGLKSNSTKGGSGYNEYIMDDTKGNELIREHGQHDKDSTIEHDLREHVHHDRARDVTHNERVQIGGNQIETVAIAKAETIGAAKALTIGAGYTVTVGGAMNTAVALASFEQVGLTKQVTVGKVLRIQAGDSIELVCGKSVLILKKDGTINLNGKDIDISSDKHIQLGSERIDIN